VAHVGEDMLILTVHVDDCIFTGTSQKLITQYKEKINSCYALTDLGPVHWLLGIKVIRDRAACTISLSQVSYIDAILARFGLTGVKPYSTPMIPNIVYSKDDSPSTREEEARMSKHPLPARL